MPVCKIYTVSQILTVEGYETIKEAIKATGLDPAVIFKTEEVIEPTIAQLEKARQMQNI